MTIEFSIPSHDQVVPMEAPAQSPVRILIVEDDEATSTALLDYFGTHTPYQPTTVGDVDSALRYLSQSPGYDVVLLDISLPGRSGFELLEDLQTLAIDSACILLTSRDRLEDKLRAFRLKADDYIVKPYAVEELQARVEAVLRRRRTPAPREPGDAHTFQDFTIDFVSNGCFRDGRRIPLTALEFDILQYLVEQRGRVVPREELRDAVWAKRENICLRTIDRHVAKIRDKIEKDGEGPAYLQTVYGKGYEFAATEYA